MTGPSEPGVISPPPSDFSRSLQPSKSGEGDRLCPPHCYSPPPPLRILWPSYGPAMYTFLSHRWQNWGKNRKTKDLVYLEPVQNTFPTIKVPYQLLFCGVGNLWKVLNHTKLILNDQGSHSGYKFGIIQNLQRSHIPQTKTCQSTVFVSTVFWRGSKWK